MSRRGFLAVVILLALVGLFFYDRRSGRELQEREIEEKKVFHLDAGEVETVFLNRSGEQIRLHRSAGGWGLQEPVIAPADATAADDLVASLVRSTIEKRLGIIEDLSGFGLAEGAIEIVVTGGQEEAESRERLRIGGEHPFSGDYYSLIGDDPEVVLVSSEIGQARDVALFELRDRALITLQNWKMRTLEIQGPEETFSLVREKGRWNLAAPVRTPAEDGTVADLVSHLGRLEAIAFAADDPGDLGAYRSASISAPTRRTGTCMPAAGTAPRSWRWNRRSGPN
jgi:hypothetical protein